MKLLDLHVSEALNDYGIKLEKYFNSNVIAYMGAIHPAFFIERLVKKPQSKLNYKYPKRIVIVLTTPGGVVESRETLKLEIEDYSNDPDLRYNLRAYNGLLAEYLEKEKQSFILHSARI
jgi:hypothetical protein